MSDRTYSKDELTEAVKNSQSIRQVLIKLGLTPHGGNYRTVKRYIQNCKIDTSHLRGKSYVREHNSTKYPIEEYLANLRPCQSYALKRKLIRLGILERKCVSCNLKEWQGNPIPLELDHINGDHRNNFLSNLRLLCPNCHAQTKTYRGKNKTDITIPVPTCSVEEVVLPKERFTTPKPRPKYNRNMARAQKTKIEWVSDETLAKAVWEKPRSILAKEWGVSDKAIAKRCKKRGIAQPPRGYWAKIRSNKST